MALQHDFGPAVALSCRECGARYDLGPIFACQDCFGPLEVAYDFGTVTREDIAAGPANIWRYRALLPVPANVADKPNLQPGWTKLHRAGNLGAELGLRDLYVKDDSGNPTHSFKDRVVSIAVEAARNFGFARFPAPRPATWRAPSAPPPRGPGSTRACSSRRTSKRPRSSSPACTAASSSASRAPTTRSTASARAHRRPAGREVGLRQRQPAALLRRGLQDPGLRDRRAARLADPRPDHHPDRLGLPAHQDRQGLQGAHRARPRRGHPLQDLRGPGRGLLPGVGRLQGRARRRPPGEARHDRQVAGHRQPRRRALRPGHRPADRRGRGGRHRPRDRRGDPAAGPHRGRVRRDRAAA